MEEGVVSMETQTEFVAPQVNEEGAVAVEVEIDANDTPVVNESDQAEDEPTSEEAELVRGDALKGKNIRKKFGRKFYQGTVSSYDADTKWYKVQYQDGDSEDLEWKELEPLLVNEEPKKRPAGPTSTRGNKRRKTKALEHLLDGKETADLEKQTADEVVAEPEQVVETTKYVVSEELQDGGDEVMEDGTAAEEAVQETEAAEETEKKAAEDAATPKPKKRGRPPKTKPISEVNAEPKSKAPTERAPATRPSTRLTPAKTVAEKKNETKGKAVEGKPATRSASKGKRVEEKAEEKANNPNDRGMKLKGRKLEKDFSGKAFKGEVVKYDRQNKYYKIHYEDGDEEEMTWGELEPLLLPLDGDSSGPGTSSSVKVTTRVRETKTVRKETRSQRPRRKAGGV